MQAELKGKNRYDMLIVHPAFYRTSIFIFSAIYLLSEAFFFGRELFFSLPAPPQHFMRITFLQTELKYTNSFNNYELLIYS